MADPKKIIGNKNIDKKNYKKFGTKNLLQRRNFILYTSINSLKGD